MTSAPFLSAAPGAAPVPRRQRYNNAPGAFSSSAGDQPAENDYDDDGGVGDDDDDDALTSRDLSVFSSEESRLPLIISSNDESVPSGDSVPNIPSSVIFPNNDTPYSQIKRQKQQQQQLLLFQQQLQKQSQQQDPRQPPSSFANFAQRFPNQNSGGYASCYQNPNISNSGSLADSSRQQFVSATHCQNPTHHHNYSNKQNYPTLPKVQVHSPPDGVKSIAASSFAATAAVAAAAAAVSSSSGSNISARRSSYGRVRVVRGRIRTKSYPQVSCRV